jgi:hypothetical protein
MSNKQESKDGEPTITLSLEESLKVANGMRRAFRDLAKRERARSLKLIDCMEAALFTSVREDIYDLLDKGVKQYYDSIVETRSIDADEA